VSASIELNVTKLDVDFRGRNSQLADVELQAELYTDMPAADDVVALYVDGDQVFAAPFSQFAPVKRFGDIVDGLYALKTPHLWVQIDFVDGRLSVNAEKVALLHYNPANGVDIQVILGDAVAVDNVQPIDEHHDRHFRHRGPERGRGHCAH
jgi:hypothetical protein